VIGVKYSAGVESRESARLWVEFTGGRQSPLEPSPIHGHIGSQGYNRDSEANHVRRDVAELQAKLKAKQEEWKVIESQNSLRLEALNLSNAPKKGKQANQATTGASRPSTAP